MAAQSEFLVALPAEESDEALMLAYAAGSARAFDRLYMRHKGGVYRYLLRHCGNASTADELFQDVWMSAIRARERYTPTSKFATWLYTIARHRLIDYWRSSGRAKLSSLDDESENAGGVELQDPGANAEQEAAAQQLGERLHAALAELSPAQRDAFLLQYEGGLSIGEIAAMTGVGAETAKSRLRYAVTKLRGLLAPIHEEFR